MRASLLLGCLTALQVTAAGAPAPPPRQHGVVYFLPPTGEESVRQLQAIKADGFNLICIASWCWTVPTPGSDLRKTVEATLDWCDRNGMAAWLLHNIQYGSPGEGGDVEAALDGVAPKARDTLAPWAEVLRGHPSVTGVLLGNEVGPGDAGLFPGHPRLLEAFRSWALAQHGDLVTLNARWGTHYASAAQVQPPQAGDRGGIDVTRFCRLRFAVFYDRIAAQVLKPVLGEKLYGSKGGASPYVLRQMPHYTVCSWDDLLANWPLWKTKLLVDTCGRPVFNSELHLYNDDYAYGPSPEQSRHRYFTSALLGEWMTASFAWGQWRKPPIARVHAATTPILADLRRLEPALRAFNGQAPAFEVLVTEGNEEGLEGHPRLEVAYAHAAATGLPWRFLADLDLEARARQAAPGPLCVDAPWLTQAAARSLAALARTRRVVFIRRIPTRDEYHVPLPQEVRLELERRCHCLRSWADLPGIVAAAEMPAAYREIVDVPHLWWSAERGHYRFPVKYPRLEARRAVAGGQVYVAVTNHTEQPVKAPLPFVGPGRRARSLPAGTVTDAGTEVTFGPLAVALFEVQ